MPSRTAIKQITLPTEESLHDFGMAKGIAAKMMPFAGAYP
jgi:hypothetical protein